jgi:hypothetical protein
MALLSQAPPGAVKIPVSPDDAAMAATKVPSVSHDGKVRFDPIVEFPMLTFCPVAI